MKSLCVFFQAGSDSSPVSERPCTTVAIRLLHHSVAPAFCQPSTSHSTEFLAQQLWLSGLFSCRPMHSLELTPGFHPGLGN